ncbi:MAG: ABC transporter substrate-binding protein, partial [Chloroflexi bacterium]|nr:ABC transporter substrate-binding protein [Chloroflexota bacterium]
AEIEALFAGAIDIAYVGPSPAINGYVQSHGDALRVVAGSASGGASLVVRPGANIKLARDLGGKKVATPQLGNTQDIALRQYLADNGLKPKEKGGAVEVLPIANPDILTLFQRGQIDAAWVPEPWVSRLVAEANGKIFFDERDLWSSGKFATTLVVVRREFLVDQPEVVRRWLVGHVKTTEVINANPALARADVESEIQRLTSVPIADNLVAGSFERTQFLVDPLATTISTNADRAYNLGFLNNKPNIKGMLDLTLLNGVLADLKLPQVK